MATAIPSFAPASSQMAVAGTQPKSVPIPATGAPTMVRITNLDSQTTAFVALGANTVTPGTGVAVLPRSVISLTLDAQAELAICTIAGSAQLNITTGI